MIMLAIGTLEGALLGLGLGLTIDTLVNWSSSNVAFIFLLFLAGAMAGALVGYFFIGSAYEDPWLILAGQGITALLAAMVGTAIFVLTQQPLIGRILLLFMTWGSFPGAVIGFYMALTRRAPPPTDLRRNDPMPTSRQFGLLGDPGPEARPAGVGGRGVAGAHGVTGVPMGRSMPAGAPAGRPGPAQVPRYGPSTAAAVASHRSTLLINQLEQETAGLQPRLGLRADVLPLDGGEACVTVPMQDAHGIPYTLYLTCPPDYPMRGPKLTLSRADHLNGQEVQVPFESRAAQFWHGRRSLEEVVEEVHLAVSSGAGGRTRPSL